MPKNLGAVLDNVLANPLHTAGLNSDANKIAHNKGTVVRFRGLLDRVTLQTHIKINLQIYR
jgi:hypothetical protein